VASGPEHQFEGVAGRQFPFVQGFGQLDIHRVKIKPVLFAGIEGVWGGIGVDRCPDSRRLKCQHNH